jgi:pimeloyl-ACP methyl ester carboxylesterase
MSSTVTLRALSEFAGLRTCWTNLNHVDFRYLVRTPKHWNSATDPRPIVFIHGLGLGLVQYHRTIAHLFNTFPDRPILILIQPHISQNIFHPQYLRPMPRRQMANRLARLLSKLGWADYETLDTAESSKEEKDFKQQGVTLMSHSKYNSPPDLFLSHSHFISPVGHILMLGCSSLTQK